MPTYTAMALENLLEPRVQNSFKDPNPRVHNNEEEEVSRHLYISSPSLYTTPEQAPLPEYSETPEPSPYVVNLKRRRGATVKKTETLPENVEEICVKKDVFVENGENEDFEKGEEFEDSRIEGMMRVGSEEASDFVSNQIDNRSVVSSAQGEFYDASDDFSCDGSVSKYAFTWSRIDSELKISRVSLLEEIERRKNAEEALIVMHSQWEKIRSLMSEAGLTFPAPPDTSDYMQLENNSIEQLSQEIGVTRFVAEAVGKGEARAEAEEAAAAIIESKDQEILRLKDRLQYFETVNHEMSQRKLVEVARRQHAKKQSRRRWLWSLMGLSIAIGASFVAYTYIPHTSECSSADSTDASSVDSSETS